MVIAGKCYRRAGSCEDNHTVQRIWCQTKGGCVSSATNFKFLVVIQIQFRKPFFFLICAPVISSFCNINKSSHLYLLIYKQMPWISWQQQSSEVSQVENNYQTSWFDPELHDEYKQMLYQVMLKV